MDTVKHIFRKPDYIEGIGEIHPVQMKHYDEFMGMSNVLCLSYDHFQIDELKKEFNVDDIKLLDLILIMIRQAEFSEVGLNHLTKIFSIILKKDVRFIDDEDIFFIDEENSIHRENYDSFREIVMMQNLLFTPKVYKNKAVQAWADKAIKARAKGGIKTSIEDQLSIISIVAGKDYETLEEKSIYQINMDFKRILKMEAYRTAIKARLAGDTSVKIEHFAELIDLFENPFNDIFKDKNKLNNINSAINGG